MEAQKTYIIACARALLDLHQDPQSLINSKVIDSFLTDKQITTLILSYHPGSGFKNYTVNKDMQQGSQLIHITKTKL